MHLVRCGAGDPILFVHGLPTSSGLWKGIIARLCGQYTCFAVDLPGLGLSPRQPYHAGYLRQVAEELDAIRAAHGIEKWHVVGHDAGSVVAVHYAHFFPERVACLALMSPALFPELRPFYLLEALRKPVLGEVLAPLIGPIFWKIAMRRALGSSADGDGLVAEFCRPFQGPGGSWRFMRLLRWGQPERVLAEVPGYLPLLRMPTLIFHGRGDVAIPESFARRAAALMPNARVVVLDSGHFLPLNQPEPVAAGLAGFFEAHGVECGEMAFA